MEDDAPVIYGLEFQARALTPQTAETDAIRFLVGTQSLKYDNQIHIIDFDDENNIINKNVLLHQAGEIWHISASPADRGVLATCYNRSKATSPGPTPGRLHSLLPQPPSLPLTLLLAAPLSQLCAPSCHKRKGRIMTQGNGLGVGQT
uniref:EARP complex and GARP complex interacting protein 1 n=1 Tax=Macaca fascicularis TaxID=9541 RepID=A0A7N9D0Y1_MACFA